MKLIELRHEKKNRKMNIRRNTVLVNMDQISSIDVDKRKLTMNNKTVIHITRESSILLRSKLEITNIHGTKKAD